MIVNGSTPLARLLRTRSSFWNEWFRSGDMGKIDKDGYLYIVDRLKDMIITGGENVYPKEIEEVLFTHPKVLECTVIGLPDKEWGESATAMVIPKRGQTIDDGELKAYLKTRLSAFKVPKEYRIMDQFPKSPTGKILKRVLRKSMLDQIDNLPQASP
jgi:long-chain acyl-CoA synthetase